MAAAGTTAATLAAMAAARTTTTAAATTAARTTTAASATVRTTMGAHGREPFGERNFEFGLRLRRVIEVRHRDTRQCLADRALDGLQI